MPDGVEGCLKYYMMTTGDVYWVCGLVIVTRDLSFAEHIAQVGEKFLWENFIENGAT